MAHNAMIAWLEDCVTRLLTTQKAHMVLFVQLQIERARYVHGQQKVSKGFFCNGYVETARAENH